MACEQEDEWDIVQTASENAVFMPGPDNIIRYHQGGVTVSRMEHAGEDLVSVHAIHLRDSRPGHTRNPKNVADEPKHSFRGARFVHP